MAELNPAAQAVLIAATCVKHPEVETVPFQCTRLEVAAALIAAADLERQSPWPTSIEGCGARWMRDQILAIAAELEALPND